MINDEDRGKVWERTVLMSECPFIALSATIDNPIILRDWLAVAKRSCFAESPARNVFVNSFIRSPDDVLKFFDQKNLRTDSNANFDFAPIESLLEPCCPEFSNIKKLTSLNAKLHKIRTVLTSMNDIDRSSLIDKINLELNDVILIDHKQAPTDFVYYTFVYDGPRSYNFADNKNGDLIKYSRPKLKQIFK